jgi:hypothetical protein
MRHANAVEVSDPSVTDDNRLPLNVKGVKCSWRAARGGRRLGEPAPQRNEPSSSLWEGVTGDDFIDPVAKVFEHFFHRVRSVDHLETVGFDHLVELPNNHF